MSRRFIPAPAGNTGPDAACRAVAAVHPRACGEHDVLRQVATESGGSSPRLRGTLCSPRAAQVFDRFIPAPAGNTADRRRRRSGRPVHPRACGEHQSGAATPRTAAGSSPRLRGTPAHADLNVPVTRFIPAPAGNTRRGRVARVRPPVHPRACGEHSTTINGLPLASGSSPRLRGTRLRQQVDNRLNRFIPAPAGNTCIASAYQPGCPVHPRACGEHP